MMKSNESVLDKELTDLTSLYFCTRIRLRLVEALCVDSEWRDCGCGRQLASTSLTSLVVVLRCRGSSSLALFLLRTRIHTLLRHFRCVSRAEVLQRAYNGVLSTRRDVLACGTSPLLSRRRGDGVREWDESCSSEQDCGSRAHEVRHQCDS